MGQDVPSHPGPIPASHGTGMGPNFFSWDGMGPNLCGMGAPGPTPSQDRDRDGTRPWWDGSSHPGPTTSLGLTLTHYSSPQSIGENTRISGHHQSHSIIGQSRCLWLILKKY